MKKFLLLLVAGVAILWGLDRLGVVKLPFTGADVVQTAQRTFGGRRAQQRNEAVPVLTSPARREDVPVTLDAVGTVQALNTVVVRAQVEGRLDQIAFRDGQDVKKGDVLARIDPRTYQAQYDQSVAKKAQDEAQLANARIDLDRYTRLAAGNFGSRQQADTQQATVAQLEAQVRVDQALIDNAKAILDYTTITAPIDGRTGLRAVDAGNIIRASDATGLVTITQMKPVTAVFSLPQQNLRAVNSSQARGRLTVQALDADNTTVIDAGGVDVVDNQVDITTGTVRVKATFPNADLALWPGQFVNVRLYVDVLKQALVVPSTAVQRGPKGAFVYVLTAESKASMRPVTVLRQDERLAVLQTGVDEGAPLITTGFGQITEGTSVKAQAAESAEAPVAAPAPNGPPRGQRGAGQGGVGQGGAGQGRRAGEGGQTQRAGQAGAPTAEAGAPAVTR